MNTHEMARWSHTPRWVGINRLPHHLRSPACCLLPPPGGGGLGASCSRKPNVAYISLVYVEHFTAGDACLQPAACQIWRSSAEGRRGAGCRCCS